MIFLSEILFTFLFDTRVFFETKIAKSIEKRQTFTKTSGYSETEEKPPNTDQNKSFYQKSKI